MTPAQTRDIVGTPTAEDRLRVWLDKNPIWRACFVGRSSYTWMIWLSEHGKTFRGAADTLSAAIIAALEDAGE